MVSVRPINGRMQVRSLLSEKLYKKIEASFSMGATTTSEPYVKTQFVANTYKKCLKLQVSFKVRGV